MTALSWVGYVLLALGLWFQGRQAWWAYAFSIAGEALWVAYAVTKHDWALTATCLTFGALALRALLLWRKEAFTQACQSGSVLTITVSEAGQSLRYLRATELSADCAEATSTENSPTEWR